MVDRLPPLQRRLIPIVAAAVGLLGAVGMGCAAVAPTPADSRRAESSVFSLQWARRLMPEIIRYRDRANPLQGAGVEVDPAGNRLFAGSADDHLYALDATTGRVIWRSAIGAAVHSRPLYMPETRVIFFGTDNGTLLAYGADAGDRRWVYNAEAEIRHRPVLRGEALYISAADNSVHAVDWTTGAELWRYRRDPSDAEFEVSGHAGVAVGDRTVYTGFSDGSVVALDAFDGSEIWTRSLAEDIERRQRGTGLPVLPDVDTTPMLSRRHVFVASYEAGIYALDRDAGAVVWRQPLQGVVGLAGTGTTLYASRSGAGLVAVSTSDGRILWERPLGPSTFSEPVVHRDLVVVGDGRLGLAAVRRVDGQIVQRFPVGSGAGAAPVISGHRAFVVSNGGVLAALSVR